MLIIIIFAIMTSVCCNNLTKFPPDFKFGLATASYQVEGGWNASGKGESIWDYITHTNPNYIKGRANGDVACDSYHLWKEDVQLLKNVGVDHYRFSLSWPRILPTGFADKINSDGIRYYNDLINELLKNNIEPLVTLYHWDLPQRLQELGGWANLVIARYYEDFVRIAFQHFGDRVKKWITFNEPYVVCENGYGSGGKAPALHFSGLGDYLCGRTLLLAHARAYHLYDKEFRAQQKGEVGITINANWLEPGSKKKEDIEAAERAIQMLVGWWSHPIYSKTGDYPQIMKDRVAYLSKLEKFPSSRLPEFTPEEVSYIRGTGDFFGLNHYGTTFVRNRNYSIKAPYSYWKDVSVRISYKSFKESELKDKSWGFRKILNWIKHEYQNPNVYITENGLGDRGELNDQNRIHYFKEYLKTLLETIHVDKCNVTRYTAWSLMDNFEWRHGYTVKYGIHHVDFSSPRRTRTEKASARFYKEFIKTSRLKHMLRSGSVQQTASLV